MQQAFMKNFAGVINFESLFDHVLGVAVAKAWLTVVIAVLYVPVVIFLLRFAIGVDGKRQKQDLVIAGIFFMVSRLAKALL